MSLFGRNLRINIFGESHGPAIGVVIEGIPAGILIDMELVNEMLERRRPGTGRHVTRRTEGDVPEIISGVLDGKATGMPIACIIRNNDTRSSDYKNLSSIPRPGHADYTAYVKYNGFNDIRGGGAFSGRLTAPLVFAGALAISYLKERNITIVSHLKSIGGIKDSVLDPMEYIAAQEAAIRQNRLPMIDSSASDLAEERLTEARMNLDSLGSEIETAVYGLEAGIGEPGFNSLESMIASICFGVPGVKGIEFGKGFELASMKGSRSNDEFHYVDSTVRTYKNDMGGILGGISNGMPLVFNVCMKPTSSISRKQRSVDLSKGVDAELEIKGRHDPCIGIRAVPVIESCAAIALMDSILEA